MVRPGMDAGSMGDRLAERPPGDDEAAHVDGEVAREALQLAGERQHLSRTRAESARVEAGLGQGGVGATAPGPS